jgi:hypothetical protein
LKYFRDKRQLNTYIKKQIPNLKLKQANGYCYWYSDDKELAIKLAGLDSTSIYTCYWQNFSIPMWEDEINILKGKING